VFITNDEDVDFSNKIVIGNKRVYYDGSNETDLKYKNTWTEKENKDISTPSGWVDSNVIDNFYIDLSLCGKKNENNIIEDCGCPIVIKNREVQLDNFVSGILTIFLNGRVFDDKFAINELTTSKHKSSGGSYVIGYHGFGKNIILPKYSGSPLDEDFVFIPIDNSNYVIYYDFMVNNNELQSKTNYIEYFGEKLNFIDKYKYTFKK
jgi:hypothetical protein